jgi:hypothetical protein
VAKSASKLTHNMLTIAVAAEGIARIALSKMEHAAWAMAPVFRGVSLFGMAKLTRNLEAGVGVGESE